MNDLPDIVVVGSINVDLTALADRLPTPGETIGGGTLYRDPGGKGANQAVAASRLGSRVRMIGAVGNDADGVWMLDSLQSAGVDTTGVRVTSAPTGTALIAVDRDGENQIVVCQGANASVTLDGLRLAKDETVLTQLEINLDIVVQLAARTPSFIAVNAAPAQFLPPELVERVDLFIVNETEYALMPELRHAKLVAVTYGGDGAALVTDGAETARVPAFRTTAVNTVGAGDAFCAALTIALRAGASQEEALHIACAVGAAAVAHPSSRPPFERIDSYAYTGDPA